MFVRWRGERCDVRDGAVVQIVAHGDAGVAAA